LAVRDCLYIRSCPPYLQAVSSIRDLKTRHAVCRSLYVTYRRVLDWIIGFIDILYIQLGTTGNYSAIGDLTLYSSPLHTHTHTLGFSVFTSRILATYLNSLSLRITHEVFFSQPNFFLAIILQVPIPKTRLNSIPLLPGSSPGRLAS
jgi:hypothetical protein